MTSPNYRLFIMRSRKTIALILLSVNLILLIPTPSVAEVTEKMGAVLRKIEGNARLRLAGWRTAETSNFEQRGIRPIPESKEKKESRVRQLKLNPSSTVILRSEEPMVFTAIPVDGNDAPIHGLLPKWDSNDPSVVFIKQTGEAIARKPGFVTLTARTGSFSESVQVKVRGGNGERFGGKKKQDSLRDIRSGQVTSFRKEALVATSVSTKTKKRHHLESSPPVRSRNTNIFSYLPLQNPNVDPLPDSETSSLYKTANIVGVPFGKQKAAAAELSAATDGTETNGDKNFTFALPIVSLPGRGLSASLSLVYNSAVWTKSVDSSSATWMTYDVDSGWPATGWRLSLGQIEDQGSNGFTLTDPNGTRHALVSSSSYNYDTIDGTFIHFYGAAGWGTLSYPDGTVVQYGASGGGYRSYPVSITDRNGNMMYLSYVNNIGPQLYSIIDTMGRYIRFYYASNGDLVTITAPGLSSGSDRQVMRFYYTDVTLGGSLFGSGINVSGPSSVHTLQYVYLPGSSDGSNPAYTGYKFAYSPYGMVREITQSRGMTVSSTSTTTAGSVTSDGTLATRTIYNYPTSGQSFTDVPTYPTRSDEWAGRTTGGSAPSYSFSVNDSTGVSTVTAPDGTISETHAIVNTGQWNDGLVSDNYIKDSSTTYWRTHMDWEVDANGNNPRIYQSLNTDVPANLTKATVLTYTTYNNISVLSERDFGSSQTTPSSTELRRTETTYVTSSNYTNRYLLHLPSSVRVFPGGSGTSASSRVDYAYDNYGSAHYYMTPRSDIIMHSDDFNPFCLNEGKCDWDCVRWNIEEECIQYGFICPYVAATDYRGNVTSVTTYSDAATPSGAITRAMTYDVAGNLVTAEVDCCQQKSFTYSGSGSYAYVTSITSGNPAGTHITTSADYDYNTGLIDTTTDENSQTTTNYYNTDSLRLDHITYPNGGAIYFNYSDGLNADAAGLDHFYVETALKLDSNGTGGAIRYRYTRQYFDGRGATARTMSNQTSVDGWSTQDTEYDAMGRPYRVSNPYFASGYGATPLTSTSMFWTTSTFDHLGRLTQLDMPRGDNNNSYLTHISVSFDGAYTTTTDPAGKVRRQKTDALGRLIRLDEPTTSGLGTVTSPNQATSYDYDVRNNLIHITQGSQHRYFMYDSLSRLIRERQTEQTPNSSYDLTDSLTGNSSWTRKFVYNSSSLTTDSYDARGIHATFSYDDLNRLTTISYSDSTPTCHYYYDSSSGLPTGAPSSSSPDSYSAGYSTGRIVAMTYGSGATGTYFGYDANGRVVQQFQLTGSTPTKYKLSYAYNNAGLLTSETYPSGRVVDTVYDEGGRLSQLKVDGSSVASSFQFEPNGALKSETWGNTAVHTQTYNKRLQPSQVKLTLGSSVLQQFDYGWGTFNTSTGAVDTSQNNGQLGSIAGTIGTTSQWLQGFQYDELGRLANISEYQGGSMSSQTYSQGYTYDSYGNKRQSANGTLSLPSIASSDYDTTNNNRFVSSVASYDNGGNITADLKFRNYTYSYDANGRTSGTSKSGVFSQTSTYDCAGQRVQTAVTTTGTSTRTMIYDIFGQLVADYSGSSGTTLESENVYRGGQLLARYNAGSLNSWNYILSDVQGTSRTIMDNNGGSSSIVARHDYLPFGEEIAAGIGLRTAGQGFGGTDYNRLKYALTERDDVTNLDHTWFRKFDNLAGRFTSPDPAGGGIENPQSFNKYSYTHDDPVNLVDPTGLRPQMCGLFSMEEGKQYFVCFGNFDPFYGSKPKPGGGGKPKKKPKKPSLADKIKECAKNLFGVEMTKFVPSSPGNNGQFEGVGPNVLTNGGNDSRITITNDVKSYSGTQLGIMDNPPGGAVIGRTYNPNNQYAQVHGLTPFTNYTANDLTNRTAVVASQIHELGNSLAHVTGLFRTINGTVSPPQFPNPYTGRGDQDPGVAMERCVFGGDVDPAGHVHAPGQ